MRKTLGQLVLTDWKCVCGHENRKYHKQCFKCNQDRKWVEDKSE